MAVELLRENGIDTIFMTKEKSAIAKKRALKLKVSSCLIGVERKEKECDSALSLSKEFFSLFIKPTPPMTGVGSIFFLFVLCKI